MENIMMLILFVGPGLFIKAIRDFVYRGPKSSGDTYDKLFGLIMHSVVIFFANLAIMHMITSKLFKNSMQIKSISDLVRYADSIQFLFMYAILTLLISLLWCFIYDKILKFKVISNIENRLLKNRTGTMRNGTKNVYDGIFHDKEITSHLVPVSIYQNDALVTSGCIKYFNAPNFERMEFRIEYSHEISEILMKDKEKSEADKILPFISFEYIVPEYNLKIKFYEPTRLEKHWFELYGK